MTTFLGFGARAILGEGGRGGGRHGRQPRRAAPRRGARRRRGHRRRRPVPRDHRRRGVRDDPRGRRRPRARRPPARWRTTSGRTSSARASDSEHEEVCVAQIAARRDRRARDRHRDHRRRGAQRLVPGRPRLRGRGERELPGAAARADLAALQHRPARSPACSSASVSSSALVIISPKVWPGAGHRGLAVRLDDSTNPGIVSIPLGFLGCWSARCSAASAAPSAPPRACTSGRRPGSARRRSV